MTRHLALAAVALLGLLSAACGKSKEEELFDQRHAACRALVGAPVSTAVAAFPGAGTAQGCSSSAFSPIGAADVCPQAAGEYTEPICVLEWAFYPSDPGLCDPGTGCWYGCLARVTEADFAANGTAAVVCAAQWFSKQPQPPL